MALCFTQQLPGEGRPMPDSISAHPKHPLIATGWSQGKVEVTRENGERVGTLSHTTTPSQMVWHPVLRVLVVGWRDGQLTAWSEDGALQQNPAPVHEGLTVTALEFTSGGAYLVSSSKACAVALWSLDDVKLNMEWSARTDIPMTTVTHLSFPTASVDNKATRDDDILFCMSGASNVVMLLDENQNPGSYITIDRDQVVKHLLWDAQRRFLVVHTNTNVLIQYHIDFDGKTEQVMKSKIASGPNADMNMLRMVWVAPGLLASTSGEDSIQLVNLATETMYVLRMPEPPSSAAAAQPQPHHIASLAALFGKGVLAVASREGAITTWNYIGPSQSGDPEDWQLSTVFEAEGQVDKLTLTSSGTVAALQPNQAIVLEETVRRRKWTGAGSVVQLSPDTVAVETTQGKTQCIIQSKSSIREVDFAFPYVTIWTGKKVEVYSVNETSGTASLVNEGDQTNPAVALHNDGIFLGREQKLLMVNHTFQQIAAMGFTESEGNPQIVDSMGEFLVVITNKGYMKVARISSRDLRVIGPSRPVFKDSIPPVKVVSARINARGKKVILMTNVGAGNKPDSRLHVYDVDTDQISNHDFAKTNEYPVSAFWNNPQGANSASDQEYVLLACETKTLKTPEGDKSKQHNSSVFNAEEGDPEEKVLAENAPQSNVYTLFASPLGVVTHHHVPLQRTQLCLVGCTVPNVAYCTTKPNSTNTADNRLELVKMRDFAGMQADNDPKVREALMHFAYHTTLGNMDEAFRAVKTVRDTNVWTNLAKLCVTTRRLDVAQVCLANMNDGVAARSLRQSEDIAEPEARIALLALSLGMNEDAERLLRKVKRDDLLTEYLVASGKWDAAEKHASLSDRIRLRTVHYRHAQFMEHSGNFDAAVRLYEKAGCMSQEVARMLWQSGQLEQLRHAAVTTADEGLLVWWAQYLESQGDLKGALEHYEQAKDVYNIVRMLTCQQPPLLERAVEIVTNPANKEHVGAGYFIGQAFETSGDVTKAIHFFNTAGAYKHAIHIAKQNDLYGEVVGMALKSDDRQVLLDTGVFFEERSMFDKAVQMFQKAGDLQRAIDVCIRGGLYDELHRISEQLDSAADPETFIQMAEHFINSGHYDKAVQMLIFAKAFNEALQLCMDKNVNLTEEMAGAINLPKSDNEEDEEYRISLLKKVAKVAKAQENWHLACQRYTQAGERVKAMKMLLRSGDTEKIIFFANHSRNQEIYVLAGNYLQTCKWQNDATIYKNIITFYTKAKAFESLAGFYDACSQLQIDEYRDYDKALTTMRESLKVLEKGDESVEVKRQQMRERIAVVENFVNSRRMIKPGEPCPDMVQICSDLLHRSQRDHPDRDIIETALRVGDVYALLVEYYDKLGQQQEAFDLMVRMRSEEIELSYFLEAGLVEKVCGALGKDAKAIMAPISGQAQVQQSANYGGNEEDIDDFVEEAVD